MNLNSLSKQRVQSIDILRGIVMLLMALDHVRDFFHTGALTSDPTNMATTTVTIFFSRWVTNFCAPVFVFLSGVSAYIVGTRRTTKQLSQFMLKRGLWLIIIELVIVSFCLTLNPFYNAFVLQVIWVIGISMILLGLLVWLPVRIIAIVGLVLILGHNLLDLIQLPDTGIQNLLLKVFFTARGTVFILSENHFVLVLYAVLPWTGVMLIGYSFGTLYKEGYDIVKRKRILILSGLTLLGLFVALRLINSYGDPTPWAVQKSNTFTFMSFLNVSKYPPSLMYLSITLGVSMLVLAFTEHINNKLCRIFMVYGKAPFFYYIVHFFVIRVLTVIVFFAQGFTTAQIITKDNPFLFTPNGFGFNLAIVYLLWLAIIMLLYYPCRWFYKYKTTHKQWWLSYL